MFFGTMITAHAAEPELGQSFEVQENTIYYQSSDMGGTGRFNIVNSTNKYVPSDHMITINGVSYLDKETRRIVKSEYYSYSELMQHIPISSENVATNVMFHICTPTTDLGWVKSSAIMRRTEKKEETKEIREQEIPVEKTPEQLVKTIEEKEGSTIILVDQSGSMYDFTQQAMRAFNRLDLSNKKIIVFAESSKEILKEEISEFHEEIGGGTNIYGVINDIQKENPENLVIITDLGDNFGEELKQIERLKTVEIYCPDAYYPEREYQYIKEIWKNVDIRLSMIK